MDDLISRKALIEAYDKAHKGPLGGARKLMEKDPAVDAVEVVRCKDCKYCLIDNSDRKYHLCMRSLRRERVKLGDYCSFGERKENEAD